MAYGVVILHGCWLIAQRGCETKVAQGDWMSSSKRSSSQSSRPLEFFHRLACRRTDRLGAVISVLGARMPKGLPQRHRLDLSNPPAISSISTSMCSIPHAKGTPERSHRVLMHSLMQLIYCQHLHPGFHSPMLRYINLARASPILQ